MPQFLHIIIDIETLSLAKAMHRLIFYYGTFQVLSNPICQLEQKFRPNNLDDHCSTPALPTNSSHP